MLHARLLLAAALCLVPASVAPAPAAAQQPEAAATAPADPDAAAVAVILRASRSDRAELRANAVEAIQHAPDRALPLVQAALEDENAGVRFAALYVVGRQKMDDLGPAVERKLAAGDEPNPSVRAAVVFAAAQLGLADDATLSRMARYLFHDDPRVRANAVLLMGEMKQPGAATMLRHASAKPAGDRHPQIEWALLRLQVAEALAKGGDAPPDPTSVAPELTGDSAGAGIRAVRAAAYSTFDEVRVLAVQALGRLGDEAFWGNLNNFLNPDDAQPVEFKLAAARSLADLGRGDRGLFVALPAAEHELPTVRAQAAFALGAMDAAEARSALAGLLSDPAEPVRLAAAAAWLERSGS
ncbi:HEAT repeat domain-containing protein [Phycisphaera mikurensis]|uniref:HEAT repeat-containing protein n=1 Tax=Phycisphaera mikurensis (strain NBRC 102666 / KCTC 22515 / FYK2301M01) TaxID=1142394 RepID=I0ID68_PHYMF|nr:HEAT repeat domain-containing protein [Phycisphaera mikurensis]MBB6442331.1 HEAT repeat protein [Phycisphaera mikurensis]BAM03206.1 hypothetical protein PSMK_10470 [Phycisphaera mikurensis NBRC 102666]